ncbi:MAG: T9SS type A sorting domain-containing protein [Bacteroidales bacterium]|nr:T9SS type A sorting domain-containing protein [Bacteroidales bacterium]
MTRAIITFIAIILVLEVYSQSCLPNGIVFSSQEQIDNFQSDYPECSHIEGYLNIGVYAVENDITNLNGLNSITQVDGDIQIFSTSNLISLSGLDNLSTVQGSIHLGVSEAGVGNFLLADLSGLNGLTYIGNSLEISHNTFLTSLLGLESLNYIGGALSINNNSNLTDISALENISNIGESLAIYDNFSLVDLSGLDNIASINGNLYLSSNANLNTLTNLSNLVAINGNLKIYFNGSLTDLNGLNNLTSIDGDIQISINNVLVSLDGINNIDPNTIQSLTINNNSSLTECHIQSVCDYLDIPEALVDIRDNVIGCNNQEEVELACETIGIYQLQPEGVNHYPNPSHNKIVFDIPPPSEKTYLIISDIYGKSIKQIKIYPQQKQVIWNCQNQAAGIYFYQTEIFGVIYQGKIVIQP